MEDMDLRQSHWKFDQNVANVFDEHVRQSVPMYEEIHQLVADMSCWFIRPTTRVYDIGTSTGEALHRMTELHTNRDIRFIGYDTSHSMIDKARERFKGITNIEVSHGDITEASVTIKNASFVTCILTAQFIAPSERQSVIQKIYDGLNAGGGFILVEKVIGSTPRFDQMYVELYHELKIRNGLSIDHVQNKMRSLRGVQRPNTIEENQDMLKQAGFKEVDICFKWCNFTAFLATK